MQEIIHQKKQYLDDPCRASSIPYWKVSCISVPENMKILHGNDFRPEMLEQYDDEPYFRLKHNLRGLKPVAVPEGFFLCKADVEELAGQISACYDGCGITAAELESYGRRAVYCPELWLVLRDVHTGGIAASGIAELDREIGEGMLEWIQVSGEYRRRGLGRYIVLELLWRMKGRAEFVTVSGRCNNPADPEGLYRGCGFEGNDVWHVLRRKLSMLS